MLAFTAGCQAPRNNAITFEIFFARFPSGEAGKEGCKQHLWELAERRASCHGGWLSSMRCWNLSQILKILSSVAVPCWRNSVPFTEMSWTPSVGCRNRAWIIRGVAFFAQLRGGRVELLHQGALCQPAPREKREPKSKQKGCAIR